MTAASVLKQWLGTIGGLTGRRPTTPKDVPNEYMTIFLVQDAVESGATESELCDFLIRAFRAYCAVGAAQGIRGWFYAWFDEMSGTLRCSLSAGRGVADLPFSSRFEVSDDPRTVTRAALGSEHLEGIPASELETVPWAEPGTDADVFVLSVYARPIVHSS